MGSCRTCISGCNLRSCANRRNARASAAAGRGRQRAGAGRVERGCLDEPLVHVFGEADCHRDGVAVVVHHWSARDAPIHGVVLMLHGWADHGARFAAAAQVLAVHAEGSIEAEKMQVFRSYDARRAVSYARRLAGLDDPG